MIRNIRDIVIALFFGYALVIFMTARINPEWVGHWEAQKDIAYDSIWGEYYMDCDCTEPYEE